MALSGIIIFAILIVILVVILGACLGLIARGKSREGAHEHPAQGHPERSKNMIRVVYTYVILFATLMMTIGGSVAAFMAIADLAAPQGYYQTFEEYKLSGVEGKQLSVPQGSTVGASDDTLRKNYNQMIADDKKRAQDRATNSLIKSFGWIVIPLPVFLYFQRRLKYE